MLVYGQQLKSGDIIKSFEDGLNLLCVLHAFMDNPKLSLTNVYMYPENNSEVDHNLSYLFQSLTRTSIQLLFSLEEFKENKDPDFLLLQLFYVFLEFKDQSLESPKSLVFKDSKRLKQKKIDESIENALTVLSTKPES